MCNRSNCADNEDGSKEAVANKRKKTEDKGLWIGAELNDSDFEDSSEDEESDEVSASC